MQARTLGARKPSTRTPSSRMSWAKTDAIPRTVKISASDPVDDDGVDRPQAFELALDPVHHSNVPNPAARRISPADDPRVHLETYTSGSIAKRP